MLSHVDWDDPSTTQHFTELMCKLSQTRECFGMQPMQCFYSRGRNAVQAANTTLYFFNVEVCLESLEAIGTDAGTRMTVMNTKSK